MKTFFALTTGLLAGFMVGAAMTVASYEMKKSEEEEANEVIDEETDE